jgi:hypothetical protein
MRSDTLISGQRVIKNMVNPSRFEHPLIVQCVLFLIPVNIFVIGDWLAAGVQWIFFRYQQSFMGNSFIVFIKDLYFVQEGIIRGRSAVASEMAVAATFFMALAVFLLFTAYQRKSGTWVKAAAIVSMGGGCLYLIVDMIQYGVFFHGPAGFVIPIGVPVILVCGWWMYLMKFPDATILKSDETELFDENETP